MGIMQRCLNCGKAIRIQVALFFRTLRCSA